MERISEEVTTDHRRSGLPGRPWHRLLVRALWIFLLIPHERTPAQTFEILVVEKTDRLSLFDSFQRSIPSGHSKPILPFTPLRILKSQELLSDGITNTRKVEAGNTVFYILCDDKGKLSGLNSLGFVRIHRAHKMFDDTVEVLRSSRVLFRDPAQRISRPLSKGELILRSFEESGSVYGKLLTSGPMFGWVSLPRDEEGSAWRVQRRNAGSETLSGALLDRMNEKVRNANRNLVQIYSQLNSETGKRLVPPQWQVQSVSPTSYTVILLPATAAATYAKSISGLTSAFQTWLLGTGFDATALQNRIEVRRR